MARKDAESTDFEDFFTSNGIEVTEHERAPKSFVSVTKALSGMLALSIVLGGLLAIPGFVWGSAAAQVAVPVAEFWKNLPSELPDPVIGQRNKMLDKNGDVFAEIWSEDRINLDSLDKISPLAIQALIDTEDKRFYDHNGFDPIGTARAALKSSGGGSGITQQLVKNLQFYDLAGKDKKDAAVESSLNRKVQELKYSMSYENSHTKNEILLNYFNTVAFGSPNVYSIQSASQYFFGKNAIDLNLAEAAALVGSVQNPVAFNMNKDDPETVAKWKGRQASVLDRMLAEGSITEQEAADAKAEELQIVRNSASGGNCASSEFPFYCEYTLDYLMDSPKFGETPEERAAILDKGGLLIKTHLDPVAMRTMEQKLSADYGNSNRVIAPSAVVEPGTGGVVAFAANREYGSGPEKTVINLADTPAGTGSTYKMIALAAAFDQMPENQLKFGSACPLYPGPGYDAPPGGFGNSQGCGKQAGVLDYKQATAWSSNTWFITLAMKVGMDKIISLSEAMDLNTEGVSQSSLSMVLGSKENSPISMAAAYATFANDGVFCPATPVASYEYADGTAPVVPDTYDPASTACKSVISPASASGVLRAMKANTYAGEVPGNFGAAAQIQGYDAVGKSGTNQHLNSIWAQVSENYSLYTVVYDMDRPDNGFFSWWNGGAIASDTITTTGSNLLRDVVSASNPVRKGLNYSNTDRTPVEVPVDLREFFTVPSLNGMKPEEALATARSLGLKAEVSKETAALPEGYRPGVVVEQSIEAGTQLPVGTKKELILYLGE